MKEIFNTKLVFTLLIYSIWSIWKGIKIEVSSTFNFIQARRLEWKDSRKSFWDSQAKWSFYQFSCHLNVLFGITNIKTYKRYETCLIFSYSVYFECEFQTTNNVDFFSTCMLYIYIKIRQGRRFSNENNSETNQTWRFLYIFHPRPYFYIYLYKRRKVQPSELDNRVNQPWCPPKEHCR